MPRTPVSAVVSAPDLLGHGGGAVVVVCDDGTVWVGTGAGARGPDRLIWTQMEPPLPGSTADGASAGS